MRTTKRFLAFIVFVTIMMNLSLYAQDSTQTEYKPVYLTVTTLHWNPDPETDFSDWLKTEKEYFDKVTSKNDLIIGSGYYRHYFTPDNSEILAVSVYKNWEDIEKADEVSAGLIKKAWPDEAARTKFMEKQAGYYSRDHSDEIYQSMNYRKDYVPDTKEPLVYYVRHNKLGNGKGSGFKEYFENVTQKNNYIKGYSTLRHKWGSNSRDAIEVFVFKDLADLEKSFKEDERLAKAHWPDEASSKAFFDKYDKIFSGHGDYVYHNVPELEK